MTATVTSDFRHEFQTERRRLLRSRFIWFCSLLAAVAAIHLLVLLVDADWSEPGAGATAFSPLLRLLMFASALAFVLPRQTLSRERMIRLVFWLVMASGAVIVIVNPLLHRIPVIGDTELAGQRLENAVGPAALFFVFVIHFTAALFIPWSPEEAIKPLVPLLFVFTIMAIVFGSSEYGWSMTVILVAISPIVGVPGMLIAWWRTSRFHNRFHYHKLRATHTVMKKELTDARRIHEALFPAPILTGPVRFDFRYQPMRQIGGDFLFVHHLNRRPGAAFNDEPGPISVVMLDVTGHGIAAALTVNRLYGELERLFAEQPDLSPGQALVALNRYVHLTMATHGVYATAICLRADPHLDTLEWASGGHPPAFLRTVDGRFDRLDSTAIMLGAVETEAFTPSQQVIRFARGDMVLAYTDGATEATDHAGHMLRVDGLQRAIASVEPRIVAESGWATATLGAVDAHRDGPPDDDTLIIELYRPLERP